MFVHRLKLRAPQVLPTWIERPKMARYLSAAPGVLAMVAGPGYGKTVLAAHFYAAWRGPRFWYGLDSADVDLAVFAAHMAEMLRTIDHPLEIAGDAWRLGSPSEIGAQFAEVLAEIGPPAPLLVFDDVQVLENSRALQALEALVRRSVRAGVTFVLCGRSMPLALHGLAASAQLYTITAEELAFDERESLAILERTATPHMSSEALVRLARRVEGWPAGLAMAGRAVATRTRTDAPELLGARDDDTRRLLFDYLATEVLGSLEPAERDFFVRTSILDDLETELCDAVMGRPGSNEMLASLARRGLFVSRRSEEAFTCHQLFREFLRHTLSLTVSHEELAALHARAATAAASRGDAAGEVAHLLAAGDFDAAGTALERSALGLLFSGLIARVHSFLEKLGTERIERSPTLLVARGRVEHQRGEWDRALGSFERAIAVARAEGNIEMLAEAVRLSSPILASRGEFARLLTLLEQTLALEGLPEGSRTSLSTTRGAVLLDTARYDDALVVFRETMPGVVAKGDLPLQGMLLHNTAVAHMRRGEPYPALAMYERALKVKRSAGQRISAMLTTANTIYALRVVGDLDEAERLTRRLLDEATDIGNASLEAHARENEGGILLARGDLDEASRAYAEALAKCDPGDLLVAPEVLHGMARCALAQGDAAEADALCSRSIAALRAAGRRQELAPVLLTRAAATLARGAAGEAAGIARQALESAADGEDGVLHAGVALDCAALLARAAARGAHDAEPAARKAATAAFALLHERDYRFLLRTKAAEFAELREHMARWGIGGDGSPEGAPKEGLRIELLGALRVTLAGDMLPTEAWKRRRARDIFAYLVSLRGKPVPRARLVNMYWPETDADSAHDNLRVTISAIRKAVGDVVRFESNAYRFVAPPNTAIDLETFDAHVDAARQAAAGGGNADAHRRYGAAADLYRGEFLEGMEDGGWQWRERERLRAAYFEALRFIAAHGDERERGTALDRILEAAPFDLEAVRLRLGRLVAEARVAEAKREHEKWRARYRAAVGAEPPDVWPKAEAAIAQAR